MIHHVDVACNWRSIKNVLTGNKALWPTLQEVAFSPQAMCSEVHRSVLVLFHERADLSPAEVRDWLRSACPGKFEMFNRFYYETKNYTVLRSFEGVVFKFAPAAIHQAVYFKLAFGGA